MEVIRASHLGPFRRAVFILRGYLFLTELKNDYLSFTSWFFMKVFPDIYKGKREIIFIIVDKDIAAIAILKDTQAEKKICTLRVADKYQNNGFGSLLFEESFRFLGTMRPFITVPSRLNDSFQPILSKYGFKLTEIKSDYYRKGSNEYCYNGHLKE